MPEVSVILPNFNHARFLHDRIGSILNQTFHDFELIILDDCSVDNSREIIETYRSDPRVSHILYNAVNSGSTFKQWNKGISLAAGQYIWIAESDDNCDPDFLGQAVTKMREFPTAGIVYAQSLEVEEESGKRFLSFSSHPRFSNTFNSSYFKRGVDEVREKLAFENTIPNASAVLFRKSVYLACGGADESMRLVGDWMLWSKMLLISDVFFIAQPLNYFRLTSASARSRYNWLSTFGERMRVLNFIIGRTGHGSPAENVQVAFLRRAFNSFGFGEIRKAFQFIRSQSGGMKNKNAKIGKAFLLSLKDRTKKGMIKIANR